MKKEEEKSLIRKSVKASMSAVKKLIVSGKIGKAVDEIKGEVEDALDDTKKRVTEIADHLTARLLSFSIIIIGLLIGFVGLAFFLVEYMGIDMSISFILVGLLVLCLGWLTLKK